MVPRAPKRREDASSNMAPALAAPAINFLPGRVSLLNIGFLSYSAAESSTRASAVLQPLRLPSRRPGFTVSMARLETVCVSGSCLALLVQRSMDEGNRNRSLAHCRCHPFDIARPHVTDGHHAA